MCAIAGLFDPTGSRPFSPELIAAMTSVQAHRGPDGHGYYHAPGVALGHRRLSIIDVEGSPQPMLAAGSQVAIVFNGEIYNFADIRAELESLGHRFRTRGDTETILLGWLEWGERVVERLRGMFAFAIHDARTHTLFLARDRLGVKPLHWAELPDGTIAFASEIKGLLAHPGLPRDLDPAAVEDYFALGYVPDPRSLLAAVNKLPPAHTLTIQRGRPVPAPRRWWDVAFEPRLKGSDEQLAAELVERVRESVRLRMIADVPLGAFLSGGVDSSSVVAMMAGLSDRPVKTCTIGFDVAALDETAHARRIARRYCTDHRERLVSPDDFSAIDALVAAYDEPFADASALPTFRVCQLARETVTVALSGDGADEAFAGYRRYGLHMLEQRGRDLLPAAIRRPLFGALGRAFPKLDWAPRPMRAKTTLLGMARSEAEAYFNSVAVTPDHVRAGLFSPELRRALGGYRAGELYARTMADAPAADPLGRAQYADLQHWLPGDILTKADRASMAVSLEVREPLLDHELVEWAAALPPRLRLRGMTGKWLLKTAMAPFVDHDLLHRPKMGFVTPIAQWLRGPLHGRIAAIARSGRAISTGWFAPGVWERMVREHRAGAADHSRQLWQLLMLDAALGRLCAPAAAPVAAAA